ncbi:MAG: AAA family ATPase, partial [Bacteroidetes bacterium]|nr:AAA family ATPase [Bacteroidota bacterium]
MINNINDLIKVSKDFSIPEGEFERKEKGRQEFVTKFPLEKLSELTVDDYCQGTTKNSFCYWLEFKDILFGIGGGNASKFGIYKSKEDGNYYEMSGPNKTILSGGVLEERFAFLK